MQIQFRGYELEVEITYFESPYPAKTNCYPDDGYEGSNGELEFEVTSGNELLDELLEDEQYQEELQDSVLDALEKDNY